MNVFRDGEDYVFALTYGTDVDWVKNVLAADGCQLETRGRIVALRDPVVVHDPSRRLMPWLVRTFLGVMRVTELRAYATGRLTTAAGERVRRGRPRAPLVRVRRRARHVPSALRMDRGRFARP